MSTSQGIEIFEVSYILDYISNLLLISQLRETGISYHDVKEYMILKRGDKKVSRIKQS